MTPDDSACGGISKSNEKSFVFGVFPLDGLRITGSIYNESTDNQDAAFMFMMRRQRDPSNVEANNLLGDFDSLADKLGSTAGLMQLAGAATCLDLNGIADLQGLKKFLEAYRTQILMPLELPAISEAAACTSRNESRELLALDDRLSCEPSLQPFASASRGVACRQLRNLRALRDERVVQRYLQAVERHRAQGWHTVVYGIILGVYSIPIRQGLANYAQQTQRAFIDSAARRLKLSDETAGELLVAAFEDIPRSIEAVLDVKFPMARLA